jgi:hypothetical protein
LPVICEFLRLEVGKTAVWAQASIIVALQAISRRASKRLRNQFVLRHSSRSRPLKLSICPFCMGSRLDVIRRNLPVDHQLRKSRELSSAIVQCSAFGEPRRAITSSRTRVTRWPAREASASVAWHSRSEVINNTEYPECAACGGSITYKIQGPLLVRSSRPWPAYTGSYRLLATNWRSAIARKQKTTTMAVTKDEKEFFRTGSLKRSRWFISSPPFRIYCGFHKRRSRICTGFHPVSA